MTNGGRIPMEFALQTADKSRNRRNFLNHF